MWLSFRSTAEKFYQHPVGGESITPELFMFFPQERSASSEENRKHGTKQSHKLLEEIISLLPQLDILIFSYFSRKNSSFGSSLNHIKSFVIHTDNTSNL